MSRLQLTRGCSITSIFVTVYWYKPTNSVKDLKIMLSTQNKPNFKSTFLLTCLCCLLNNIRFLNSIQFNNFQLNLNDYYCWMYLLFLQHKIESSILPISIYKRLSDRWPLVSCFALHHGYRASYKWAFDF